MPYVAQTTMMLAGEDKVLRQVLPGEPIADFESWPRFVQRSHLEAGRVARVGAEGHNVLSTAAGRLHMTPSPRIEVAEAESSSAPDAPKRTKKA